MICLHNKAFIYLGQSIQLSCCCSEYWGVIVHPLSPWGVFTLFCV